jgi:hypothetical protein
MGQYGTEVGSGLIPFWLTCYMKRLRQRGPRFATQQLNQLFGKIIKTGLRREEDGTTKAIRQTDGDNAGWLRPDQFSAPE